MEVKKKVLLNNEEEEELKKVEIMYMRLKLLDPTAFKELFMKCKDSNHEIFGKTLEILQGRNLLEDDGSVSDPIKNIVLSATKEEGEKLTLIDPIKKTVVRELKDALVQTENSEEKDEDPTELEVIQKNLFKILDNVEKNTERQRRFKDFIEIREIKEEDYPIIAQLYTYPNDEFILWFHNAFFFEKERSGKTLEDLVKKHTGNVRLKRFFELFLQFFEKYGRNATNHLNRVMENKKEWKRGLNPK